MHAFLVALTLLVGCGTAVSAERLSAQDQPYLAAVRQFADQVLVYGRDASGIPTPLFVDGLNVDTLEPVKWKWADGKEWVLSNLANHPAWQPNTTRDALGP